VDRIHPVGSWLAWPLLSIYAWELVLSIACAGFGRFVLQRILRLPALSPLETWAFSFPVGLIGFGLGMFAGGYLGLFGPVFAVALPAAMSATWLFTLSDSVSFPPRALLRWIPRVATAYGLVCLAVVYLGLLSPDALNYDATWSHLVVAQDYAREGRIVPFLTNWPKNLPHFASLVQTWCFIVPGPWPVDHPVRWMFALHTEFSVLLWTLAGVSALVDWLCDSRVQAGWVVFFLFPSIFVWDSNLGGNADHFAALFACPIVWAAARAARGFEARECALVGLFAGGAAATKVQAGYMLAPIALLLACRWLWLAFGRFRQRPASGHPPRLAQGPLIGLACFVAVTCPQAIERAFWHHNPVYPFMQSVFTNSVPTMPGAAALANVYLFDWHLHPPTDLAQRTIGALGILFWFSVEPHDSLLGKVPFFGSLFTLLSPIVIFLPRARRLWMAVAAGGGAIFLWAFIYRVDRNLQTFLPILAAATGALIVSAWRMGTAARLGLLPLIALQVCWSGDLIFSGSDRLASGIRLIRSSLEGRAATRFDDYRRSYREVGQALPGDALVLLHHTYITLGINRRILVDFAGWQSLIDYRPMKTARDVYDRFTTLGVTHLIVAPGTTPADSKQEDAMFDTFVALYAKRLPDAGGFAVFEMPQVAPPMQQPYTVFTLGLVGYPDGIYDVADLERNEWVPPAMQKFGWPRRPLTRLSDAKEMLAATDVAIIASSTPLDPDAEALLQHEFRLAGAHGLFNVYVRPMPQ
jgi:hypothetical protein